MPNRQSRQNTIACSGHAPVLVAQASESVWQPRFPQVVFFVEALNLSCFNKSGNRKGMWKSIFATSHTDSEACATKTRRPYRSFGCWECSSASIRESFHAREWNNLAHFFLTRLYLVVLDGGFAHGHGVVVWSEGPVPFFVPADNVHDQAFRADPIVKPAQTDFRGRRSRSHFGVITFAGLDAEDAEIVGHLGKLFFAADRTVTWNDYIHVPARDLVAHFDPFRDVAIIGTGRDPEDRTLSCEENFILRQVSKDVAPGIRGPRKFELHLGAANEIGQVIFEGHAWRHELARLRALRYAGHLVPHFRSGCGGLHTLVAAVGMTQNFRVRKKLNAVDVITMMVRVDQTPEILAGGLFRRGDESVGRDRSLRGVNCQQVVGTCDHPGIRNAGGADARA